MRQNSLKLRILLGLSILWSQTYSATIFNTANHVVVIYKILDPLTVSADKPEKLTVSASNREPFKYTSSSTSKKPINIKIERPYNTRDNILDAIFSKATLEIQSQGNFELTETKDNTKKIGGRGFFIDSKSHRTVVPLNSGGGSSRYQGSADLDVIFNEKKEKIELGIYKGVLKVDVLYGG